MKAKIIIIGIIFFLLGSIISGVIGYYFFLSPTLRLVAEANTITFFIQKTETTNQLRTIDDILLKIDRAAKVDEIKADLLAERKALQDYLEALNQASDANKTRG